MRRAIIIVFFAWSGGIIFYSQGAQAELWRCARHNETALFTDTPKGQACEPYTVRPSSAPPGSKTTAPNPSTQGYFSAPEYTYSLRDYNSLGYFSAPEYTYSLRDYNSMRRTESFETFRGVVTGMTQDQVLEFAGYPDKRDRLSCGAEGGVSACPKRWVYSFRDQIVELIFDSGRLIDIKNVPRP
jgi:hypothetical protein